MNKQKAWTGLSIAEYNKQYGKQYDKRPKKKAYRQIKVKCVCGKLCSRQGYYNHTDCVKHKSFITQHQDLSELFQLEMEARFKTALASIKLNSIKL